MTPAVDETLREIYDRLWAAYGPQHWWPARTSPEIVVGAILAQNTAWTNVERAIAGLRNAHCLTFAALRDIPRKRLEKLIQPSGTYRIKAARLEVFVDCLWKHHGGSLRSLLAGDLEQTRRRLLAIHGIGPETADAILLYAGNRPTFVVDAYTKRILRRHFLTAPRVGYETVRQLFHRAIPPDARRYNEFHALLVALGKRHCQTHGSCEGCPLADLPHNEEL